MGCPDCGNDHAKHMKVTGSTTEITPPGDKELPPCPKCFLIPTRILLHEAGRLSRMQAKLRRIPLPPFAVQLRPCDHMIPIGTDGQDPADQLASILGVEIPDDGEAA